MITACGRIQQGPSGHIHLVLSVAVTLCTELSPFETSILWCTYRQSKSEFMPSSQKGKGRLASKAFPSSSVSTPANSHPGVAFPETQHSLMPIWDLSIMGFYLLNYPLLDSQNSLIFKVFQSFLQAIKIIIESIPFYSHLYTNIHKNTVKCDSTILLWLLKLRETFVIAIRVFLHANLVLYLKYELLIRQEDPENHFQA